MEVRKEGRKKSWKEQTFGQTKKNTGSNERKTKERRPHTEDERRIREKMDTYAVKQSRGQISGGSS